MMVGPHLPHGLQLNFEGNVTSKPYIEMTASLMRQFGVDCHVGETGIQIPNKKYKATNITIEADWSAASYWFAFTALADEANIELPNVTLESIQGDRVVIDIMDILGVRAMSRGKNLVLTKKDHKTELVWDFTHCPDLAQTVAVVCAAKGIKGTFTGLESLRIKETDRIKALQIELEKLGATFTEQSGSWVLLPSTKSLPSALFFNTYLDHRMAMAFAPLAAIMDVTIEDPPVTRKSYPKFWEDVNEVGIKTKRN
jgi:3-phosphoshikimate 1-carboxyvinyltransferase